MQFILQRWRLAWPKKQNYLKNILKIIIKNLLNKEKNLKRRKCKRLLNLQKNEKVNDDEFIFFSLLLKKQIILNLKKKIIK